MNILFVLENYVPHIGGVEIVFKNLAEGLVKTGHHVEIVTHRLKNTAKEEVISGVNIHRVNCLHSRYWFTFLSIPKVLKYAKGADIIHTTTYNGAFPAKLASILAKKPCVITIHEILGNNWRRFGMNPLSASLHKLLEKMIVKLNFNRYVSVSKSTQRQVLAEGIPKHKSIVIYNGVDYNFWNPKEYDGKSIRKKFKLEKNFVYLFYGRPGISKGLEYLIKAVPLISERIRNAKLFAIVSKDKAYKNRYGMILKLIKQLRIEDKIILHPPVQYKQLPNYVKMADCVVVPSLSEGFGYTAAESCAMNKPVVASNTTSLPEVVSGRYVLVRPKSADAVAEGVIKVYNNKTAKSRLKRFETKTNIAKYLNCYKGLMDYSKRHKFLDK